MDVLSWIFLMGFLRGLPFCFVDMRLMADFKGAVFVIFSRIY